MADLSATGGAEAKAPKPKHNISMRPATAEDAVAIAEVTIRSFPADPEWPYRYPYREQFPDDHYKFTVKRYEDYLANVPRGTAAVYVAEAEEEGVKKVVGGAVWQLPGAHGLEDKEKGSSGYRA